MTFGSFVMGRHLLGFLGNAHSIDTLTVVLGLGLALISFLHDLLIPGEQFLVAILDVLKGIA